MKFIVTLLFLLVSNTTYAFEELQDILSYKERPTGIVIEIVSGDELYLKKIIDELKFDITTLRKRFKDLPVAIVSHADESLLLANKNINNHSGFKKKIKSLSKNTDIHVCGTYASWNNISEDEFPDFINVSPAGPVQVNDYIDIGYLHIEL